MDAGRSISPEEAKKLKDRYNANTPPSEMRYVMFSKECYDRMFNEGAKGIRNYMGLTEDDQLTIILEGVDEDKSLVQGGGITAFEFGDPCPPPEGGCQ